MDGVTESIGMLVVQVERFSRVAATVLYLVLFVILLHISCTLSWTDKNHKIYPLSFSYSCMHVFKVSILI